MALIAYKDYWFDKLRDYRAQGILQASGIQCPQCALELWTTAPMPISNAITKDGNEVVRQIPTYPAICRNGHQVRL